MRDPQAMSAIHMTIALSVRGLGSVFRKSVGFALGLMVVAWAATAAQAASREDIGKCAWGDAGERIAACTLILDRGGEPASVKVIALVNRGAARMKSGDPVGAERDFEQALGLDPRSALALRNRARLYAIRQEYDRAIADYDAALKVEPAQSLSFVGRGFAWLRKGEVERSIRDFDSAIALDPNAGAAYRHRGDAFALKGDRPRAEADYAQAARIDPTDPETVSRLAEIRSASKPTPAKAEPALVQVVGTYSVGERIALVVGNAAYQHAPPLANPSSDAALISQTLKDAGFQVVTLIDADQASMKRALLDFGRQLRLKKTEAGLFYYAGHGVQVRGENYLIPVDARIEDEDEVELEGVNVNDFLSVMNSSQSSVNIVVLDACRNNPFRSASRSASRGLAIVRAPKGAFIAYATSPDAVALDGDGANSPYTKALAAAIAERGRSIESVFKSARVSVEDATEGKQTPWDMSSIKGEFYFHAPGATPAPDAPAPAPERQAAIAPETPRATVLPRPTRYGETCAAARLGMGDGRICVSSVLAPQFGNSYAPSSLADGLESTAWVEGARGQGLGESIVLSFAEPRAVASLSLVNGYAKTEDIFRKNGRVRSMTVTTSAGDRFEIRPSDTRGWQAFNMPSGAPLSWISLEITGVYPGSKYADTAVSELAVQ